MRSTLLLSALLACDPGGAFADPDAARPDAAPADAAPDAGQPDAAPPPGCDPAEGIEGDLDPDGPVGQIHAAVAADGDGWWFVYNRPDEGGKFDVWATRIGCDGERAVAPFLVNEQVEFNHTDPAVAVSNGRVLFAWSTDDQMAPYNLSIRTRVFDAASGDPMGPERRVEFDGNAWMVRLVSSADGFWLVGSFGVEEVNAFQVFTAPLDVDGVPLEPPTPVDQAPESQLEAAAWADAEGRLHVAWTEGPLSGGVVRLAVQEDGGWTWTPPFGEETAAGVVLGGGWVAAGSAQRGILLRNLGTGDLDTFHTAGAIDHGPGLAGEGDAAVLSWYRVIRGTRNEMYLQSVAGGAAEPLEAPPVAHYPPALAEAGPDHVLVAWSEGDGPAFRVRYRVVPR